MKKLPKIFMTGTMRTGGSLLINLLSTHSKINIFNEMIHFFRFIYYFNYHLINLSKLIILLFSFSKITRFIIKTHEIPTNKLSLKP